MTEAIRALIVEDVALARAALARLLQAHTDVLVTGEAGSIAEAQHLIGRSVIDLALLDIRLPDGNGVDLARDWPEPRPQFVFITATPEHAVDAFSLDAEDYLLKPITAQGLDRAMERVRRRRSSATQPAGKAELVEVRDGGRTIWLDPALIDYVDVAGHYLCIHVGRDVHLMRRAIGEIADQLGSDFVRIHRSVIVRLDQVRAITERRNGDADAELAGGAVLKLSRSYRAEFDARMSAKGLVAPR